MLQSGVHARSKRWRWQNKCLEHCISHLERVWVCTLNLPPACSAQCNATEPGPNRKSTFVEVRLLQLYTASPLCRGWPGSGFCWWWALRRHLCSFTLTTFMCSLTSLCSPYGCTRHRSRRIRPGMCRCRTHSSQQRWCATCFGVAMSLSSAWRVYWLRFAARRAIRGCSTCGRRSRRSACVHRRCRARTAYCTMRRRRSQCRRRLRSACLQRHRWCSTESCSTGRRWTRVCHSWPEYGIYLFRLCCIWACAARRRRALEYDVGSIIVIFGISVQIQTRASCVARSLLGICSLLCRQAVVHCLLYHLPARTECI